MIKMLGWLYGRKTPSEMAPPGYFDSFNKLPADRGLPTPPPLERTR